MSTTYYRLNRDLESGDTHEWWRTDTSQPAGQQVQFSNDGGHTWQNSILPTAEMFLEDIDGDGVQVDPPTVQETQP